MCCPARASVLLLGARDSVREFITPSRPPRSRTPLVGVEFSEARRELRGGREDVGVGAVPNDFIARDGGGSPFHVVPAIALLDDCALKHIVTGHVFPAARQIHR